MASLSTALVTAFSVAAGPVLAIPAPVPAAPAATAQQQSLNIAAAPNARDIGGYPTQQGGGKIRYGLVYRSNALDKLTVADQNTLVSLGIAKIFDFRSPSEVAANPDKLPASIPYVQVPIYDPNNDFFIMISKLIAAGPAAQQAALGNGKGAEIMRTYYRWFVTDATARGQFAKVFKEIATSPKPVLYHCTAGKDRTGVMTALVMSALGVPKGQIYKDYLASNDYLAATNQATLDGLMQHGLITDPSLFTPILGVQSDYLDATFDQIQKSYGSFDRFLTDGLGVDAATVSALKTKLLDPPGQH